MLFFKREEFVPTCFSFKTIGASVSQMKAKFGEPNYKDGVNEKVQNEWYVRIKDDNGKKYEISVYDWKEYRIIDENEKINFHIGAERGVILPEEVVTALLEYLNE